MAEGEIRQQFLRAGALVAISTVIITTSFVGVLAILGGQTTNTAELIPWYVILGALCFVGTIVILEQHDTEGRMILATAIVVGILGFVVATLSVEGLRFAATNPSRVFVSELFLYILAAALISTGIGYWTIRHWREFTGGKAENGSETQNGAS